MLMNQNDLINSHTDLFEFETETVSGVNVDLSDYLRIGTIPNELASFSGWELIGAWTDDQPHIPSPLVMDWK